MGTPGIESEFLSRCGNESGFELPVDAMAGHVAVGGTDHGPERSAPAST